MTVPTAVATFGTDHVECAVLSAVIHHGRDDATSQPEASTASFELVGPLPSSAVIGARVTITATLGATTYPRFAGEVTDIAIGWDDVDTARPTIIATGDLARLGRRNIGDVPWSQELDGARVSRILTAAGFPPDPLLSDPGTVQVLARDVDRQPALALAQGTATDGAGIVWQDRQGRIRYADAVHRKGSQVAAELRSCDIGLEAGWSMSLEGLVNDVWLRYGPTPTGGDQAELHRTDSASIAARGTFGASLTTELADVDAATKRAELIIGRQSTPAWIFGDVSIELAVIDTPTTAALLALEMHDLLSVTGLPTTSPASSALLWVEGWRETIQGGDAGVAWRLEYATSDYCRTAAASTWDQMPAGSTWDSVSPAWSWDKSYCLAPQPSKGRWNDAPSSIRWNSVDPAVTWDAWPY